MAHDSQIVRAKEILKLSHGGSSQSQASGTKQRMKALRQMWLVTFVYNMGTWWKVN